MCKIGPQWHLTWQAYLESSSQETHIKAQLCLSPEHLFCLCRYKKNIKALYIVHPTMFIKTLLILFKPIIRCVGPGRALVSHAPLCAVKQVPRKPPILGTDWSGLCLTRVGL